MRDYPSFITSQHRSKPNFMNVVDVVVAPLIDVQNLLSGIKSGFDIYTAIGAQLDVIGEWVGFSRKVATTITGIYFEMNGEVAVGWNKGVWKDKYDPEDGVTILNDEDYRIMLKAKIAANSWDGTIPGAYNVWSAVFNSPGSFIVIEDNQDMSITVGLIGFKLSGVLQELIIRGYLPLKPQGVSMKYYAMPYLAGKMFAFDKQNDAMDGWNIGHWPYLL